MRLSKVRVQNYKCIEDSETWSVDATTCLVGKNEAGKSALLEALYKLNPVAEDVQGFALQEYPRRRAVGNPEQTPASETVVTTSWALEAKDLALLGDNFSEIVFQDDMEVVITKGYDNKQEWFVDKVETQEADIVKRIVDAQRLNAAEKAALGKCETLAELSDAVQRIEGPTSKHSNIAQQVKENFPDNRVSSGIERVLRPQLPYFVYFRDYERLPGRVAIDDLIRREQSGELSFGMKIFKALLALVGQSAERIRDTGTSEELIMRLEAVSNRLTREIFQYWSQNKHLRVEFRFDSARPDDSPPFNQGWIFSTRIRNDRHEASVLFDERSSGFISFFSFLIWFSQMKENYSERLLVLLDEPGLTLHGKAQKDLLRYIHEKLEPEHQVIYTTHSPFMIDGNNIFSLRGVEDVVRRNPTTEDGETILGTKVTSRILTTDQDSILPLQGKVGYDIAQTLFVGPCILIVEGPAEWAYLKWFNRELTRRGQDGLDVRWSIAPAEGASKVSAFVTLFKSQDLKIAALLDDHKEQKRLLKKLSESKLLDDGHLLKTTDFVEQKEADFEDVIGWELFAELVNGALGLRGDYQLSATRPAKAQERVVKEVEAHTARLPPSFPEFDHFVASRHLYSLKREDAQKLSGLEPALERIQELFDRLNGLVRVGGQ